MRRSTTSIRRLINECFNLGDILRSKQDGTDWRVILTPHCHLLKQTNHDKPRADHVLLVKAVKAEVVLGEKLDTTKNKADIKQAKETGQMGTVASTDRAIARRAALVCARFSRHPPFVLRFHASRKHPL